ncbi:MAG: bacteriohemerythrin [Betaproteobacteria bacterium]
MRHHLLSDLQNWTADLGSGIATNDQDFKHLADLINKLDVAMSNDDGTRTAGDLLDELLNYVILHFDNEELLMRHVAYSDYSTHTFEHRHFVSDLMALKRGIMTGSTPLSEGNYLKLTDELNGHIRSSDKSLRAAIK